MVQITENKSYGAHLNDICEPEKLQMLFELQQSYIQRSKTPYAFVFIALHPDSILHDETAADYYETLYTFLISQIRSSDFIFNSTSQNYALALLSFSGEYEAAYFLKRVEAGVHSSFKEVHPENEVKLSTTIIEVANSKSVLESILQDGVKDVQKLLALPHVQYPSYDKNYSVREIEKIKVSIIENDPIVLSILQNLMERSVVEYFDFEIKAFSDGQSFLESDWYNSGHTHIVLLNDILPRANGIEILHKLRNLPNNQKYIIFMMSKRQGEEAFSYSYENGVDAYFTRPFDLRLMTAQINSILKRVRL
ncbi:MAG: response regulator [Lysinibacillus sp.]